MEALVAEDIGIERYYTYVVKLIRDGSGLPQEALAPDSADAT